ncbi:hypothetical protein AB0B42_20180 [Streptomyces fradiae]|uniref:hypothetical protein n=1 Tax=Streptomyces fradiae TaxID=1906 RepID=UPI00340AE336
MAFARSGWTVWGLVLGVLLVCACPGAFEGRGAGEHARGQTAGEYRVLGGRAMAGEDRVLAVGAGVSGAAVGPFRRAAPAVPAAVGTAATGPASGVPAAAGAAVGPVDGESRTPGCRDGSGARDGGMAPAAPPRGFAAGDLLAAPHDGRGDASCAGWAAWEPDPAGPERAPPALVPPSPMDLSILRV